MRTSGSYTHQPDEPDSFFNSLSEPFFSLEIEQHKDHDGDHDEPDGKVSPAQFELGHVFEVHAVETHDEGKWS